MKKKYTISDKVKARNLAMTKFSRNMDIVRMFEEGKTKEEIGVFYKISGQRVDAIRKAMKKYLPQ